MQVLGIETSCDETAVAIYDSVQGLRAHQLHSQIDLHALYGGVVPELAARDHVRKALPLIQATLDAAHTTLAAIDGIAYTAGPGLVGALLVGAAVARSLAYARGIPALGVHHLEGHLLAPMLEPQPPQFPFLALLVSGGHTLLAAVTGLGEYQILGGTLDDAAGEAFDKTAKLLGLPYPGGPHLARLAEQGKLNPRFQFPRPMLDRPGLDFSFSGLKTAVVHAVRQTSLTAQERADVAYAFQTAVVETLITKCERALAQTAFTTLVVAGGVSANLQLRAALDALGLRQRVTICYPRVDFCTDNAAMIAYAGCQRLCAGEQDALTIRAQARWDMNTIRPPHSPIPLQPVNQLT